MESNKKFCLKEDIVLKMRKDQVLKNFLQYRLNVSHATLYRWMEMRDEMLTTANCLALIREYAAANPDKGIDVTNMIEEVTVE